MAFMTMTSIGYGDFYPGSFGSRIISFLCGVIGTFFIASLISIVE